MSVTKNVNILRLVEIFIALIFFALAMAVCAELFAAAREYGEHSADVSRAVVEAQSIAECYKAAGGDMVAAADLLGTAPGALRLGLYYDEGWRRVSYVSTYSAELVAKAGVGAATMAEIVIYKGKAVLYRLSVAAMEADEE